MLKGSFYSIQEFQAVSPSTIQATIRLNPAHAIFEGHFPGTPVVPGVCMLQILKECLEEALNLPLTMEKAGNIKFLTVLTPTEYDIVAVSINFESSGNGLLVSEGAISSGAIKFVKVQQVYYANSSKRYSTATIPL